MTIDTPEYQQPDLTTQELDEVMIEELCAQGEPLGIQLAIAMEIEETKILAIEDELGKLGIKFDNHLDSPEAYGRILKNGLIAESVKKNEGEKNEYNTCYAVYLKVREILDN